ncbi:MAG: 2-hydroxyacid dehydrogenase [Chitinophagaceae bacterium]
MKTAFYSIHKFETDYLLKAADGRHELKLLESRLSSDTALQASGSEAVCIFVNDDASATVLEKLSLQGIRFLALRSAGFNHVDLKKAKELGIRVARVPDYSPYAVAEHTVALMLALNRKLIRAHNRIMEQNFSLDGLTGFDMHGKTAGVIGTGKIGAIVARILYGFGCKILAHDNVQDVELKENYGVEYTDYSTIYKQSDIITLHIPLTDETKYLINRQSIDLMKSTVMLINTSRGGLIDTKAVIQSLKKGQIGFFGMDVYEEEKGLFFEDHSDDILQDDVITRLMTFKNVLITSHQAFLTDTALQNIAETTILNLDNFQAGISCENEIK